MLLKCDNLSDALISGATALVNLRNGHDSSGSTTTAMSPGKRAHVSGQYLEQLERFKGLHQSGVLSLDEFGEQKKFPLNNIRELIKVTQG